MLRDGEANRKHAAAFRESRTTMGFRRRTIFVPAGRERDIKIFLDKITAEYFLHLVATASPTGPAIAELSKRYLAKMPTREDLYYYMDRGLTKVARPKVKACLGNLEDCAKYLHACGLEETSESDYPILQAKAVAHSYMAAALWGEIMEEMEDAKE